MKRLKLFVCLASCALVLAGCGGSDGPELSEDAGLTYSSEKVEPKGLLSGEYEVQVDEDGPFPGYASVAKSVSFAKERVISSNTTYGLYEVTNEQGWVGFYSALHNDWLVSPHLIPDTYTKNVYNVERVNYLLEIHYKDLYYVYDGLGNLLGEFEHAVANTAQTVIRNELVYLTLTDTYEPEQPKFYFEYSEKGVASEVSRIPEEANEEEEEYEGLLFGDLFTEGFLDLEHYGLAGYKLVDNKNGFISVFEKDVHKSSFYIGTSGVMYLGVFGKNVYFQVMSQLPERSEVYSFSVNNSKYHLETYQISVETGEKTLLEVSVVFDSVRPFHDENKKIDYTLARYRKIEPETRTLGQYMQSIVDSEFIFHNDVSGVGFSTMTRISENRYIDNSGVLYDENLKPLTYVTNLANRVVNLKQHVIYGKVDGKYGLVDFDGKVIAEFKYDNIYVDCGEEGNYIALKGNDVFRVNTLADGHGESFLGRSIVNYTNNFYRVTVEGETSNEYLYFSSAKNLFSYDVELNPNVNARNVLNGEKVYFVSYNEKTEGNIITANVVSSAKSLAFELQQISEKVKGSPRTDELFDGSTVEKAYRLSLGVNTFDARITGNNSHKTYLRFDPKAEDVGRKIGFHYVDDGENITSFNSTIYKVIKDGSVEAYKTASFPGSIIDYAYSKDEVSFDKFRYITVEEDTAYVVVFNSDDFQINQVGVGYVDGIIESLSIELGTPGLAASTSFKAPTFAASPDVYVNVKAYQSGSYAFAMANHVIEHVVKVSEDLSYLPTSVSLTKFVNGNSATKLCIELESFVPSETLVLSVVEPANGIKSAQAVNFGSNDITILDEGRVFYKFVPTASGEYYFTASGISASNYYIAAVNADGEITSMKYYSGSYYSVIVPEKGYALIMIDANSADTGTLTIGGITAKSIDSFGSLSTSANFDLTYGARYYKFTASEDGKVILASTNSNYVAKYRINDGSFTSFNKSFEYAKDDEVFITVAAKSEEEDMTSIFLYNNVGVSVAEPEYVGHNHHASYEIAAGATKYFRFSTIQKADLSRFEFSSSSSVYVSFAEDIFVEADAGLYTNSFSSVIEHPTGHNLCVAVKNTTASTVTVNLALLDESQAVTVRSYVDLDEPHFNVDALGHYYVDSSLEASETAQMEVLVRETGIVTFKVKVGRLGNFNAYSQYYDEYSEEYIGKSTVYSMYAQTGGYVLVTAYISHVNSRIVMEFTRNSTYAYSKDFTVSVADFTFEI